MTAPRSTLDYLDDILDAVEVYIESLQEEGEEIPTGEEVLAYMLTVEVRG